MDGNCIDDYSTKTLCKRKLVNHTLIEQIPENIRNRWDEDTPYNRAQTVVNDNLDYMNWALSNSEIPIRYVQWGKIQDIGETGKIIGSGYKGSGGTGATRSSEDVIKRY